MRIFRSKTSLLLGCLFVAILWSCMGCWGRNLSVKMETQYEADHDAWEQKKADDKKKYEDTKARWEGLKNSGAPDEQVETAQLDYYAARQNHLNPSYSEPERSDNKYDEPRTPRTGHRGAQPNVKVPPITTSKPDTGCRCR